LSTLGRGAERVNPINKRDYIVSWVRLSVQSLWSLYCPVSTVGLTGRCLMPCLGYWSTLTGDGRLLYCPRLYNGLSQFMGGSI